MNKSAKFHTFTTAAVKFNLWQKLPGIVRMVKAIRNKTYKPKSSPILIGILAIAYAISPLDFIPDFLAGVFGLGLLDDFAIMYFGFSKVFEEVERYLNWEFQTKRHDEYQDAEMKVIK